MVTSRNLFLWTSFRKRSRRSFDPLAHDLPFYPFVVPFFKWCLGNANRENGTFPRGAGHGDGATVLPDDAIGDEQPQSGSFSSFGGIKQGENLFAGIVVHADAIVSYGKDDFSTPVGHGKCDPVRRVAVVLQAGVGGIFKDIDQRRMEVVGIHRHAAGFFIKTAVKADAVFVESWPDGPGHIPGKHQRHHRRSVQLPLLGVIKDVQHHFADASGRFPGGAASFFYAFRIIFPET